MYHQRKKTKRTFGNVKRESKKINGTWNKLKGEVQKIIIPKFGLKFTQNALDDYYYCYISSRYNLSIIMLIF